MRGLPEGLAAWERRSRAPVGAKGAEEEEEEDWASVGVDWVV